MTDNQIATCPFSGHDGNTINVRFFRGTKDGIISADEIEAQTRSAGLQHKMGTALVSKAAPTSANRIVDVRELVKNL